MHALLEALRRRGELYLIGAEVALLEVRDQPAGSARVAAAAVPELPQAKGEVHSQLARVRLSNSDGRKFHVYSGTATLTLRAETM